MCAMARWGARPTGDGRSIADQNLQQATMMPGREHHPSSAATAPSRRNEVTIWPVRLRTGDLAYPGHGCSEGSQGLVGGALPAVVGTVGGREVEGMCRLASEEQPVLERLRQARTRLRATRKRAAYTRRLWTRSGSTRSPRAPDRRRHVAAEQGGQLRRHEGEAVGRAPSSSRMRAPLPPRKPRSPASRWVVLNRPPTSGPPGCRRHASPARTRCRARSPERSSRCVRGEGRRPLLAKGRCRGEGGSRRRPGLRSRQ